MSDTASSSARIENPFPSRGTVNLESGAPKYLPTLRTEQFEYAKRVTMDYLSSGIGQAVTVTGPYGSGKTHLIGYLMAEVASGPKRQSSDRYPLVQLYANCKNAAFLSLYRALVGQLPKDLLRALSASMLMKVVAEQTREEQRQTEKGLKENEALRNKQPSTKPLRSEVDAKPNAQALARLRDEPNLIADYIIQSLIVPERALGGRSSAITEITAESFDDFRKVVFYLGEAKLADEAHAWMTAQEGLSATARDRLGVKRIIGGPEDALRGLRLIVRMFRDAEIPLLVYIDQIDQLLLGVDESTARDNAERLKSLVEYFSDCDAFLLLCGPEPVWKRFRTDFFTRVGPAIRLGEIPSEKCCDLVKVYLQKGSSYERYKNPEEIAPFTPDGVETIWSFRSGNARRFIQTCHQVFARRREAPSQKINALFVRNVVSEEQALLDRKSLSRDIREILKRKGLRIIPDVKLGDVLVDFLIGDVRNPQAAIKILDAAFYQDEVASALQLVKQLGALDRRHPGLRTAIVAVGYVSTSVQDSLRQVSDVSLVYEGEGFAEEFATEIEKLFSDGNRIALPAESDIRGEITESVTTSLEKLLAVRDNEIRDLSTRLDAFLSAGPNADESVSHYSGRQQQWRSWLRQDQERWEQRLTSLKKDAKDEQLRLRNTAERSRLNDILIRIALAALVGTVAGLCMYLIGLLLSLKFTIYVYKEGYAAIVTFAIGLAIFLACSFLFAYRRHFPLGLKTREVTGFNGEITQLALRAKVKWLPAKRIRRCLEDVNPLVRYFGVQACLGQPNSIMFNWLPAATEETWLPLYRSYVTMGLRSELSSSVNIHLRTLSDLNIDDPRIIHALSLVSERLIGTSDRFDLPRAIVGSDRCCAHWLFLGGALSDSLGETVNPTSHPLASFAQAYTKAGDSPKHKELARRFRETGQFWDRAAASAMQLALTQEDLQSILDSLSPYREFGLASFYQLSVHHLYLRLYRFFSEIEWRAEHGDVILGIN